MFWLLEVHKDLKEVDVKERKMQERSMFRNKIVGMRDMPEKQGKL